jgi:Zn-finger protein
MCNGKKSEFNAKYYTNYECEYYPCHRGVGNLNNDSGFNCLYCYCCLYPYECGGNYIMLDFGDYEIKDCSNCLIPHHKDAYKYIEPKIWEFMKKTKE